MSLTHQELLPGVFHICDGRDNYCTLLAGERGAILFDTMMGFDDLRGYVRELTPFDPVVINSHCHFDHMGGNYQFDRVYMSRDDLFLMELGCQRIPTLTETLHADLTPMLPSYTDLDRLAFVGEGEVFDLGGMTVEVVALPGHTPGCIGLLCRELRLLLAGDALSPQYCIFFRESLPLADSVKTLDKIMGLPMDHFLSSHFSFLFPAKYVQLFRACLDLPGKKRGMYYGYPILPEEHGRFFVHTLNDPEIGQLIGAAVKEEDAPPLTKKTKAVK